jgi:hypothetical protein
MGEWKYSLTFLDLGTRLSSVVSIMPWPLYSQGNRPKYTLDRRLDGPQSRRAHIPDSNSEVGIFSVTDFTVSYRGNFYLRPACDNSTHRQECFSRVLHNCVASSCIYDHWGLKICTHIFHCQVIQVSNILFQDFPPFLLLLMLFNHITILLTLSKPAQGTNECAVQWVSGDLPRRELTTYLHFI